MGIDARVYTYNIQQAKMDSAHHYDDDATNWYVGYENLNHLKAMFHGKSTYDFMLEMACFGYDLEEIILILVGHDKSEQTSLLLLMKHNQKMPKDGTRIRDLVWRAVRGKSWDSRGLHRSM